MKKQIALWMLVIITILFMFFFSAQTGAQSSSVSGKVTHVMLSVYPTYQNADPSEQLSIFREVHRFVRSLAHFSLFCWFGFVLTLLIKSYHIKRAVLISAGICFLCAVGDELHQLLFSKGRAFEWVDLLKDWSGSACGILLALGVIRLFRWRRKAKALRTITAKLQ